MKCPNCNNPISQEDKFCGNCGYQLKSENIESFNEIHLQELKSQPQKVSNWWYLLALVWIGLVPLGAILAWAINKDKDPKKAKNFLITGLGFGFFLFILGFLFGFVLRQTEPLEQQNQYERIITTSSEEINQINIPEKEQTIENNLSFCEPPNIFCNNKCWTPCPQGQKFICPSSGDAYCEEEDKKLSLKSNDEIYLKIIQELINKQKSDVQNLKPINNSNFLDISKYVSSVAKIECPLDEDLYVWSSGSGFLINSSGNILANYHVIDGAYDNTCLVGFTDDFQKPPYKIYIAYLTKLYDPNFDYAVLYLFKEIDLITGKIVDIKNRNFPYIPQCDSDVVKLGDPILILGYPSYGGRTLTVTTGIISGSLGYYFKTDAKIDKGNSGGPVLLDDPEKGCYIGIATFGIKGYFETIGGILKSKYIPLSNW